jgi:hypothetical protein
MGIDDILPCYSCERFWLGKCKIERKECPGYRYAET